MKSCQRLARAAALAFVLGLPARADAAVDVLGIVLEAFATAYNAPELVEARPIIQCVLDGGAPLACSEDAIAQKAWSVSPVQPDDQRIQDVVAVFVAIRDQDWLGVIKAGGKEVAKQVGCSMLPPGGPLTQPACSLIHKVVDHNAELFGKMVPALYGGDWWALIKLLASAFNMADATEMTCSVIPGGSVREVICGAIGQALAEAKEFFDDASGALAALGEWAAGQSQHIPADEYYASFWQPWYHRGTAIQWLDGGAGWGALLKKIWEPCKAYFDSHQMSESNAQETCDDMRDARFSKEVYAFRDAVAVAGSAFFESAIRPALRTMAIENFGKPGTGFGNFWAALCQTEMRKRFPFPQADESRCGLFGEMAQTNAFGLGGTYAAMHQQCLADIDAQLPSPTVWEAVCSAVGGQVVDELAKATNELKVDLLRIAGNDCHAPAGWNESQPIKFTCDTMPGYVFCANTLKAGNEEMHCSCSAACTIEVAEQQPAEADAAAVSEDAQTEVAPEAAPDIPAVDQAVQEISDQVPVADPASVLGGDGLPEIPEMEEAMQEIRDQVPVAVPGTPVLPEAGPEVAPADRAAAAYDQPVSPTAPGDQAPSRAAPPDQPVTREASAAEPPPAAPVDASDQPPDTAQAIDPSTVPVNCTLETGRLAPLQPVIEPRSVPEGRAPAYDITCRFEWRAVTLTWEFCDAEAQDAIARHRGSERRAHTMSGQILIDQMLMQVDSIAPGNRTAEMHRLWIPGDAGTHEIGCQIDNSLRYTHPDEEAQLLEVTSFSARGN